MNKEQLLAIVVFDIDGVIRDVSLSYRKAISDTVEEFTNKAYRPTIFDIDRLKSEGVWNNDWQASRELIYRYGEKQGQQRDNINLDYDKIVEFFQQQYRGNNYDGYISGEPLLLSREYLDDLKKDNIGYGFFSGATRGSAEYVLKKRLGFSNPILVAMEDAPGKPDPSGLFDVISQINSIDPKIPVFYVGDTVADMLTVKHAREIKPDRNWIGIGILPPHVHQDNKRKSNYASSLTEAGARIVFDNVEDFNVKQISTLIIER